MILRTYYSVLKFVSVWGLTSRKFASIFSEDSQFNIYKRAYNFAVRGDFTFELSRNDYDQLKSNGLVVDGTNGGLLLGNFHDQGGIYVVHDFGDQILLVSEMEGYEYILSEIATEKLNDKLKKINEEVNEIFPWIRFSEYPIPENITIIDTRRKLVDGIWERPLLLMADRKNWIINKWSTKKYIQELEKMNLNP